MKKNLFNLKTTVLALGIFFSTVASAQFTAVLSGDWTNSATWGGTAPSSTVSNQNITIPTGITVNLDADVTFNGVLNIFTVNGVLNNTNQNGVFMTSGNLAGTGTVSIGKLKFSLLGSTTYAGSLNVKTLMNSVTTLAFASTANISDTLELDNGSLSLNTNGNLTMASGSTVKVKDGSIVINSGVFNSGNAYNVMYVGTTKTGGIELNSVTLQNVYVNMNSITESVKLSGNTTINGSLNLMTGVLDINSQKLILKGDLMASTGTSLKSNGSSSLEISGTGTLSSALSFSTGSSIKSITINRASSGQVKLASAITITSDLYMTDGQFSLEAGGNLIMASTTTIHVERGTLAANTGSFSGTLAYNIEYIGTNDGTAGLELTGSGLTNITVNYITSTNKVTLMNNVSVAGKLDLMSGKLDLNGKNLILNGTFNQSTSAWIIGNVTSELQLNLTNVNQNTIYFDNTSTSAQTLSKLTINTLSSNVAVTLGSKLIIATELAFISGKFALGNADLELMPLATVSGYDDTKYIVTSDVTSGVLIQNVTSGGAYVTFPIGLSSEYSPAYVQQTTTGATGNFSAKCQTIYSATLKAVNRTWYVEGAGVTTVDANLKFGWKAVAEMNAFDRTNAYVSHFTNNMWDVTATSSATAGVNGTFELSRMGLTSLSPFAVVENGQTVGIKEIAKLTGIELYPNPSKDALNIKVANSSDEYQYEFIDVTGRTILTTSNTNSVNKFDVSGLGSGCYFVKITNLTENKTTTKRFVKQ